MLKQKSARKVITLLVVVSLGVGFPACLAKAQNGHSHEHGDHDHGDGHNHAGNSPAHHGGQVSQTKSYFFEVVYQPKETRIYAYDNNHNHLDMRGITAQAAMQMRGNNKVYRFPIEYVASTAENDHGYLAMYADVSKVRNGDMTVTFDLGNLPNPGEPTTRFTQTFALSLPQVTLAALTAADQAGITRQGICPVMGTPLGKHGPPIKLMVGNQPMYLCCKGCINKVKKDPQKYLAKIAPPRGN